MMFVAEKDIKNRYLYCNDYFLKYFNISPKKSLKGLSEELLLNDIFDDTQNDISLFQEDINQADINAFSGNNIFALNAWYYDNKLRFSLSHKCPNLSAKHKLMSIQYSMFEIENPSVTLLDEYTNNKSIFIGKYTSELINQYKNVSKRNYGLSSREVQCLEFVANGKTSREISQILFISERTVEVHVQNIKKKLGVSKVTELIKKVIMENVI